MINNSEDKQKFLNSIREISNSMTRAEAERDLVREIINKLSQDFTINKKIIRKIAKAYHKQNLAEEQQDHDEFVEIYDEVINAKN